MCSIGGVEDLLGCPDGTIAVARLGRRCRLLLGTEEEFLVAFPSSLLAVSVSARVERNSFGIVQVFKVMFPINEGGVG